MKDVFGKYTNIIIDEVSEHPRNPDGLITTPLNPDGTFRATIQCRGLIITLCSYLKTINEAQELCNIAHKWYYSMPSRENIPYAFLRHRILDIADEYRVNHNYKAGRTRKEIGSVKERINIEIDYRIEYYAEKYPVDTPVVLMNDTNGEVVSIGLVKGNPIGHVPGNPFNIFVECQLKPAATIPQRPDSIEELQCALNISDFSYMEVVNVNDLVHLELKPMSIPTCESAVDCEYNEFLTLEKVYIDLEPDRHEGFILGIVSSNIPKYVSDIKGYFVNCSELRISLPNTEDEFETICRTASYGWQAMWIPAVCLKKFQGVGVPALSQYTDEELSMECTRRFLVNKQAG